MRLVLLGPPGAGKGTQATRIASRSEIPAISTGDIFRANIAQGTELGQAAKRYLDAGDLVPDEVTIGIVRDRLSQPDVGNGFLLDGFPRTLEQARALQEMLAGLSTPLDVVLELQVDDDEVVRRISGRRVCASCGAVTQVEPDASPGACEKCGGELQQRDDDKPETVRRRLEVYSRDTAPLVDFYTGIGLLVAIDAQGPVDEVTKRALAALDAASAQ